MPRLVTWHSAPEYSALDCESTGERIRALASPNPPASLAFGEHAYPLLSALSAIFQKQSPGLLAGKPGFEEKWSGRRDSNCSGHFCKRLTKRSLARRFHTRMCEIFALSGRLYRGEPRRSRSAQRADGNFADRWLRGCEISGLAHRRTAAMQRGMHKREVVNFPAKEWRLGRGNWTRLYVPGRRSAWVSSTA